MNEDISKNTLMVLVVLTIIISLLGTWTVANEATKVSSIRQADNDNSVASGKVSLSVSEPPQPVIATGKVTLNIINSEG